MLVGGPTLMPALRARVAEQFGGRIAEGIDPMTIVARGAALYAGSMGVDAAPAAARRRSAPASPLRIEHPPVTADLEPFVVGRFLPASAEALPARVRVARDDGGWQSGDATLSAEGSFVVQVSLTRHRKNGFRVLAFDRDGAGVAVATPAFAIVHGVSVADPPLSRAIGVARADDLTQVYFAKGTPLPARRTFVHQTVARRVGERAATTCWRSPSCRGSRCARTATGWSACCACGGINCDLPAGTRVEVTLELDRSGQLHTRADVPAAGQTFDELAHVLVPTATVATAERELAATSSRAGDVQRRTFQLGVPAAVQAIGDLSALLAEAERALGPARDGDLDAAQKLHRLLIDANLALDEAEAILEWPDIDAEARRCSLFYTPLVAEWGTPTEQRLYDVELEAASSARRRRDAAELELHLEAMRSIGRASYCRDPRAMDDALAWAAAHVTEAVDVARATSLLDRARVIQTQHAEMAQSVVAARAGRADLGPVPEQPRAAAPELRFSGVR